MGVGVEPPARQAGQIVAVRGSVVGVRFDAELPASDLRLSYSQFEELEAFAGFGTRLDGGREAAR